MLGFESFDSIPAFEDWIFKIRISFDAYCIVLEAQLIHFQFGEST